MRLLRALAHSLTRARLQAGIARRQREIPGLLNSSRPVNDECTHLIGGADAADRARQDEWTEPHLTYRRAAASAVRRSQLAVSFNFEAKCKYYGVKN